MNKLVIIDGNAIIHRAYHALPPMTTKQGVLVNAVYGFTSMLLKVLHDLKPTHVAVTFDVAGGSTARLKRYKEYKATRIKADQALYDQIPLVHEIVRAFNLPIYEQSGYEADDVIGTIVHSLPATSYRPTSPAGELQTYIVTGDMDTLQLVNDNVKVYTLRKGLSDTIVYDTKAVTDRFGFGPELMVDYKALRGDPSDNIPGVPGIGEKTATELIQKIGGIDEIYKKIKRLQDYKIKDLVIKKLESNEDKARISRELSELDCAVPNLNFKLADCELKPFDREKIATEFQKFEFVSLLKRVPGASDQTSDFRRQTSDIKKIRSEVRSPKSNFLFSEVKKSAEVDDIVKQIHATKQFACRVVMSGADMFATTLQGIIFVVKNKGFYIPSSLQPVKSFHKIFSDPTIELVGHDLKQLIKNIEVHKLSETAPPVPSFVKEGKQLTLSSTEERVGGEVSLTVTNRLFDTMIASYLLNPGSRAHDVPSIILKILGKELTAGSGQESLFGLDAKTAAYELYLISLAAERLRKELTEVNNLGLFEKIEMPLIPVLAEMELNGIAVDSKKLAELSHEAKIKTTAVTKKIYNLAGQEFNISSPIQLREILFDKLNIPVEGIKKGKTGLSTDAEQLEKLRGLHPIIDIIQDYRELTKLQNTYIDVLPTLVNKTTGRIHTTFNQAVAATGRLSSSDPNLQNIPVRTELGREIRAAFIAEPDNVLVSADYSQIELRIVASLAEDKTMMAIFEAGEDIHTATAAAIHGVPLKDVTKDMRRSAKEVNFGILYGMGAYGLAWRAEIPQAAARDFIAKYFAEFSGVKKYIDRTLEFTKKEGYCETLFGRRRYLPELNTSNFQVRSAAERMAVNHPIQGTAADLMKMAMIEVARVIASDPPTGDGERRNPHVKKGDSDLPDTLTRVRRAGVTRSSLLGMTHDVKMLLQVHDELVLEVKKELAAEVGALLKKTMESVVTLRVPVVVEVQSGPNWEALH